MDRLGEIDLLGGEVRLGIVGQQLRQQQQTVERCPQLVAHVRQELRLVLGRLRELLGLLLQADPGHLDFAVLLLQQRGLLLQLVVGALEFDRLRAQFLGEPLGLGQQLLCPRVRHDRVQDDTDRADQLVDQVQMQLGEAAEGREFDDAEHLILEDHRSHDEITGRRLPEAAADAQVAGGDLLHPDALLLRRGLADEALTEQERTVGPFARRRAVARDVTQLVTFDEVKQVDRAELGADRRCHLADDHLADRVQVTLTLHLAADAGDVRLQPVLLGVLVGRLPQVGDHLVDIVLELGHLTLGLHRDGAGEVTAGNRGRHLGNRPQLCGQRGRELVDVVGERLPGAVDPVDRCLTAELALDTDFLGHPGHLVGERRELIDHRVHGVLQLGDLTLRRHRDLLREVAACHRGSHQGDVANLRGEVTRHRVHRFGEIPPHPGHTAHMSLTTQIALGTHLPGHPGHLIGERRELIDHHVHGVLQLGDLALRRHRDRL